MNDAKKAAFRLSCITAPVLGEGDPAAVYDNCRGCGQAHHLTHCITDPDTGEFLYGFCDREECSDALRKRAKAQGKGFTVGNTYYYSRTSLAPSGLEALGDKQSRSNAQRKKDVGSIDQRKYQALRRNRKISRDTLRQVEANMSTEDAVPECSIDGCTQCPRPGTTQCVKCTLEANALKHKLNPPRYRQSQSTDTELPSRSKRKPRTGNRIKGWDKL